MPYFFLRSDLYVFTTPPPTTAPPPLPPTTQAVSSSSDNTVVIIVPVVVVLLIAIILLIVFLTKSQKKKVFIEPLEANSAGGTAGTEVSGFTVEIPDVVRPKPDQWEISRGDIKLEEQLGKGAFGRVVRGVLYTPMKSERTETMVAVKMLFGEQTMSFRSSLVVLRDVMGVRLRGLCLQLRRSWS